MKVYIFISDKESRVRGFTFDPTGRNLPAEYAPWKALNEGRMTSARSKDDPVMVAVARDGFFLVSAGGRQ
jgi:hypothetical protein